MANQTKTTAETLFVIDNLTTFQVWRKTMRTFRFLSGTTTYRIDLPELTQDENQNISNLLNSYGNECGCNSGSFFMSFVFTATVLVFFFKGGTFSSIGFHQLGWLGGITFLGALTGKLFGLLQARWRIIRLTDNVYKAVSRIQTLQTLKINN
jgi:hypothetical protein